MSRGLTIAAGRELVQFQGLTLHVDWVPPDHVLAICADAMRRCRLTPDDVESITVRMDEGDSIPTVEVHHLEVSHLRGRVTTTPIPHWLRP